MICYVLPVLGLGYKLCTVIPFASQLSYGTTFRALKVTSQVAIRGGAESAVYDCLVSPSSDLRLHILCACVKNQPQNCDVYALYYIKPGSQRTN